MQGMELSKWLNKIPKESPEFISINSNVTHKRSPLIKFARYIYALFFKMRVMTNPQLPLKCIKKGNF